MAPVREVRRPSSPRELGAPVPRPSGTIAADPLTAAFAAVHGGPVDAASVVHLQRRVGNAAVAALVQQVAVQRLTSLHPSLKRHSTGKGVKKLQQRLNVLGASPPLKVDGSFGPKTEAAVIEFQKQKFPDDATQWDGKVGSHTWASIDDDYEPPEITPDQKETGQKVKAGMDQINSPAADANSGVWYSYNYEAYHPDKFTADMRAGYADPTYFERESFMTWRLKPGFSAAAGLQSWLRGLTVAECYTAMIAVEFDALRAALGDEKFDATFGSTDKPVAKPARLLIAAPGGPQRSQVETYFSRTDANAAGDAGKVGKRPNLKVGEWYYFYNHPKYLLKHPGGAWQGENAIYMGEEGGQQVWAGMGTANAASTSSHVTEAEMFASMKSAYDQPRDADDDRALARITACNGGVLPPDLDPANKKYPEKLTSVDQILDPAEDYQINIPCHVEDKEPRHGGFVLQAGRSLDTAKVTALRDS